MISKSPQLSVNAYIYEFAEFTFEAKNKVLFRGEETITLPPKACELLGVLIENAGRVISRDDLLGQVWTDIFVEEANLTHHISALRKALGEDNSGRKFIETIPRKGYRFVAPISEVNKVAAEITISEKVSARAVEEIEIETNENRVNESGLRDSRPLPEKFVGRRNFRKSIFFLSAIVIIAVVSLAAIFGNRLFSQRSDKAVVLPQAIVSKRLMPDMDTIDPAISPDGKFVVFSSFDKGESGVWQRNVQTGEMSQLTPVLPVTENYNGRFRYSPDGAWIYFTRSNYKDRRTTLERMAAKGGSPQIILADTDGTGIDRINGDFSISPDGRQIAYVQNLQKLMIVDVENKTERVLVEPRDGAKKAFGNPGNSNPAWSPGGKSIIIGGTSEENGQRKNQLIEINAETGAEKIIPISEDLRIYQIEYLADGSGLLVTAAEATGVPQQVCHISLPDGKVTTLTNDDFGFNSIRLSKDSRMMVAEKEVGSINIWTADAEDLNRRTQITKGGSALHGMKGLAITSEGQIFYTSPAGGSLNLWSVTSGGEPKQLTKNTGKYNEIYKITPDGRFIIFNSIRSGNNQIWRINSDGTNPLQLSNTGKPATNAEISPDGKTVYFISSPADQTTSQVYKVPIEGGEAVPATERNYLDIPRFSPNGKFLIYTEKDKNDPSLAESSVIEASTGKTICPAEKLKGNWGIWAKDSRHLIYPHNFGQELWQFDVYTGKREKIADFHPSTVYNFAVSPDGRKFAFSLGNISDETILFTNYLSETK